MESYVKMKCSCYILELESSQWIISFTECFENNFTYGYFGSFWEAEGYYKEYLSRSGIKPQKVDFEDPEWLDVMSSVRGQPFKQKYWDFEDYKVMAWRNAGFRSRR
jgi:hypothetical protein